MTSQKLTPAQQNRLLVDKHYPGSMCIIAAANNAYAGWLPLFEYCAMRAYPEYDVRTINLGDMPPYVSALVRFISPEIEEIAAKYDYCLITDADILIGPEDPNIVDQHCRSMEKHGTGCYDNCMLGDDRCPGVHFVTKEWWDKTRKARYMLEACHSVLNAIEGADERALLSIINESNLAWPGLLPHPWAIHGLHAGKFRKIPRLDLDQFETDILTALQKDKAFLELLKLPASPNLDRLFKKLIK